MSPIARELLAMIERYRFDRMFPELVYVVRDPGRLSDDEAEYYLATLRERAEELERFPQHLLDVPSAEELHADGPPDVEIGALLNQPDVRVGLRLLDRPRGVIAAGSMGSGKTTNIRNTICSIDALCKTLGLLISILVCDRKSSEYGDLRARLGDNWHHFSALHGAWLGLNAPLGVPPNIWINVICTLFAALAGLIAGAGVLGQAMAFLLSAMNPTPGGVLLWPDFALLLEVIERAPYVFAEKIEYAQSTIAALRNVVRASGSLFKTARGLDVEQDLVARGQSAVFDIGNLQPPFLRLFAVWLLNAQVLFSRLARGVRVDGTQVVMVNDEADQDLARDWEKLLPDRLSPVGQLFKQGREIAVMQVAGLNVLGNASRFVLANAQYHWIFNLSDEESVYEAARTLLLPRGAERLLPALRPGTCLFRQAQSSWATPVLAQIDCLPPNRGAALPNYEVPAAVPAQTLAQLPHVREALDELIQHKKAIRLRSTKKPRGKLSDAARALLDAWALEPGAPLHYLFKRIRCLSDGRQAEVRRELARHKLAEFPHPPPRIGKFRVAVMWITEEGWRWLHRSPPKLPGCGGIVHTHAAMWIRTAGQRAGYEAFIEWLVSGTNHRVDVAWRVGERWRVFEICVGCKDNVTSHIQACLIDSDAVESVTVVALQKRELAALRAAVEAAFPLSPILARVHYETLLRFYRQLYPS